VECRLKVRDHRDGKTAKEMIIDLFESSLGGAARGLGEGRRDRALRCHEYPVPCTLDDFQGGVAVLLMAKWSSAGKNTKTGPRPRPILVFWLRVPRHGSNILGKLWQLGELPIVSCYTGQA
jgi:hypothetical protein